LTPAIATAISKCKALKVLLPISRNRVEIIGVQQEPLPHMIDKLVDYLKNTKEV